MDNWLKDIALGWAKNHWRLIAAWVVARLQEPSTYAGLVGMAITNLHLTFSHDLQGSLIKLGMTFGAVLAIILKEKAGVSPDNTE